MARTTVMGVVVLGFLMGAGAAGAQTVTPAIWSTPPAIVPVTGPSVGPSVSEPAKPEVVPAVAPGDATGGASGLGTAPARHPAPRPVKVMHKSGAKSTVKKTSGATAHVVKAGGSPKAKHVAATKTKPPVHHAMVGKPIPVTKHQPSAPAGKSSAPAQPVLPRV